MYQSNTFIFFYTQVQSTDAKKWGKEAVDLTNQLIEADVLIADGVIGQSENHPQKKVITIKGPKKMQAPQRLQLKNLNAKKCTTAKKKQIEDDPEDAPLNEYLKGCQKKQKRNKDKMESLGLVNVSKKQRKIANKKCTFDHKDYLSYYKEDDRRYCKEGNDLHKVKCAQCRFTFQESEGLKAIIITVANSAYTCPGRNKCKCKHALCSNCYKSKLIVDEPTDRRRSRRNK